MVTINNCRLEEKNSRDPKPAGITRKRSNPTHGQLNLIRPDSRSKQPKNRR